MRVWLLYPVYPSIPYPLCVSWSPSTSANKMHNLCFPPYPAKRKPLCVCVSHNYLDIHPAFTDGGQGQTETYNLSWPPTRRMRDIRQVEGLPVTTINVWCLQEKFRIRRVIIREHEARALS